MNFFFPCPRLGAGAPGFAKHNVSIDVQFGIVDVLTNDSIETMLSDDLKEKQMDFVVHDSEESEVVNENVQPLGPRYDVLATIGQGGMGVVYKAKDNETGAVVAVKVLKKELTADKTALKRFEQEVASLSELDHENLVALYGQGQTPDGAPYLVMDHIEGRSLASILEEEKLLEPKRAINLLNQICTGLSEAHKKGIVHRDLKPSNIMVKGSGDTESVKILDFGIARIVESTTGNTTGLTQTGDVFGTPNYMSPEQCEGKPIDSRSDIYSMGCIMFELLTGKLPFEGSNPIQVAVKHINDKPTGFAGNEKKKKKLKEPLKSLESITLFCMLKDPFERYQTIEELQKDLRKVQNGKRVFRKQESSTRPKMLNDYCLMGILIYGFTAIFIGLFDIQYILDPIHNSQYQYLPGVGIAMNAVGAAAIAICLFRDRAMFLRLNKKMDDFWNLTESSLFAISIWLAIFLYALSYGFNTGSGPAAVIATALGTVALITTILAYTTEVAFSFVLNRFERKYLKLPFSTKTVKIQVGIVLVSLLTFFTSFMVVFPKEFSWLVYVTEAATVRSAPVLTSKIADLAIAWQPTYGNLYEPKAAAAIRSGQSQAEVLAPLNAAINEHGNTIANPESLYLARGKVHIAFKNYQAAIADLDFATRADSVDDQTYKLLAECEIQLNEYKNAINYYSKAIEQNPQLADLYGYRGLLYAKLKDYPNAVQDITTMMASGSRYDKEPLLVLRAYLRDLHGDHDLARDDYSMALKKPDNLKPIHKLLCYKRLDNNSKYLEELANFEKTNPKPDLNKELKNVFEVAQTSPFEFKFDFAPPQKQPPM